MEKKTSSKLVVTTITLYSLVAVLFAPISGGYGVAAQSRVSAPLAVIYDNGPFQTGPTSKSGVAAPAGSQWSELQNNAGDLTSSNTNAGVGCQTAGTTENRCADDFIVPVGETWTINQVIVHAYQTGFAGATSPFIGATLQIWNGPPGVAGSTVIFGDTTTNRLATSTDTSTFRLFNSAVPPPGAPTGTTRRIWQNNINVAPGLVLTAGDYWIDFSQNAGAGGNFTPNMTIVNTRGTPLANARQRTGVAPGVWAEIFDTGNPATAIDVLQEFPFKLDGLRSGIRAVPESRSIDFNGDNKSDYAIARAANATSQTTWWINNAAGISVVSWGLGVGFATGDKATPVDFDGDGRTDIAVWRPGAALTAGFYIFQSATSTVRFDQFGQTGDDPSIAADFDGDGRADPAVYRPGATGTFYYRGSLLNPAGLVTFVRWGTTGDVALRGDFDGDAKADFNIVRNAGGQMQHWQRLTTGGFRVLNYGLPTDKFVTADYDGDYKTDLVAVRANGPVYNWYAMFSTMFPTIRVITFGNPAVDILAPGDYDGDSRTDFAVWRSGQAADQTFFHVLGTLSAPSQFEWGQSAGANTAPDYPVANFGVK